MIPTNITRDNILTAISEIDQIGVQNGEQSTTYDLIYNAKRYPPKLVISLANKYANGKELDRLSFQGGEGTKAFKALKQRGFEIEKKSTIKDLIKGFIDQSKIGSLATSHYIKSYRGLKVKVSFGAGNQAKVPWIAFLKEPNKVMNGIYPGVLYYKENNLLILTYGRSETNSSSFSWGVNDAKKIKDYFQEELNQEPSRYGDSLIKSVFDLNQSLDLENFQSDLDELIDSYKNVSFENPVNDPEEKYSFTNYWIFQCNPAIYDLENAIENDAVHSWKVAAHKDKIKPGNKVIIWVTGADAKCLALGKVISEPGNITETNNEKEFYINGVIEKVETRVQIKIIHNFIDAPVFWNDIKELPEFQNFKAGNQGTNFSATKEEYETLLDLRTASKNNSYYKIKALFPEEKVEKFLNIIRNFLDKYDLDPKDERLSFNVREEKKRLVFLIGSRYVLSIEKKRDRTELSFTSPKVISDSHGPFVSYNGETEVYWNVVEKFDGLESEIENGFLTELNRGNKSPFRKYSDEQFINDLYSSKRIMERAATSQFDLNTILYGPPGTGKTYRTKEIAVQIANPDFSTNGSNESERRRSLVLEYDRLFENEQIVFTTFHQSFGYEEFVEGIKPSTTEEKKVIYDISPGIFKKLCEKAKNNWLEFRKGTANGLSFDKAFAKLKEEWEENENISFPLKTQGKDYKIIGFTESSIQFEKASGGTGHTLSISKLRDAYYNRKEIRSTGVGIYYPGILDKLKSYQSELLDIYDNSTPEHLKNYVLVIDEINRGNVSGIFGELITLLEDDKRMGRNEEISVELPYSKEQFAVPPNIFIIGTMNTADRSVEALDTALRRRFSFEEVMPKSDLLSHIEFEGFNLGELLVVINQRIEALLDRDHTIGHSYFIKIKSGDTETLRLAFENKVIPLLQEYFYHDYEKIALILGEGFVDYKEANVNFAKFKNVDRPELNSSFELKKIADVEESIRILLNQNDEESE